MFTVRNIKDETKQKEGEGKVRDIKNAIAYYFKLEYSQVLDKDKSKNKYLNYLGEAYWDGGLAEILNLKNMRVEPEHLISLSETLHPITKEKFAKKNKGGSEYDLMDLTFSAVKDFSQLAFFDEVLGYEKYNEILMNAHKKTMEYIAKFSVARTNSSNDLISCPNFLYACFKHETSRSTTSNKSIVRPDPQIHIHTIFSKYVADADGKVRVINRKFLFQNQVLFGTYFRMQVANELRNLGFQIVPHDEICVLGNEKGKELKKKVKSFKVVGISNEQRLMFSKRKRDIEYLAKKYGVNSTYAKSLIARNFRNSKVSYDRDELINIWKEDALLVGLTNDSIQDMKSFGLDEMHKHIKSDQDILRSAVNIYKGKKYLTEKNIMLALAEYAQIVPIDIDDKFQEFLFKGLIRKTSKFNYSLNFDEELNSEKENFFYKRQESLAPKKAVYLYLSSIGASINFNAPENNYLLKLKNEVTKATITQNMIENFKSQEAKFSSNQVSSLGKTLESLYQNLDDLENKLRNPKLSADEVAKIKAQIVKIYIEIEELEKKKKNSPQ